MRRATTPWSMPRRTRQRRGPARCPWSPSLTSSNANAASGVYRKSRYLFMCAAELATAVPGRLDRRDERGPYTVVLQFTDGADRGAGRRGHRLAQLHRVLARVAQHDRGAEGGLHDQVVRDGP